MITMYELNVDEIIEASPKAVLAGFIDMYGKNRPAWIHRSELDLRVGGAGQLTSALPARLHFTRTE